MKLLSEVVYTMIEIIRLSNESDVSPFSTYWRLNEKSSVISGAKYVLLHLKDFFIFLTGDRGIGKQEIVIIFILNCFEMIEHLLSKVKIAFILGGRD